MKRETLAQYIKRMGEDHDWTPEESIRAWDRHKPQGTCPIKDCPEGKAQRINE